MAQSGTSLLLLLAALVLSASALSVVNKYNMRFPFLTDIQFMGTVGPSAYVVSGNPFSDMGTVVKIPSMAAANVSKLPANGVYGRSSPNPLGPVVLSSSVGNDNLYQFDANVNKIIARNESPFGEADCNGEILADDFQRKGVWLACETDVYFAPWGSNLSISLVAKNILKGSLYDGKGYDIHSAAVAGSKLYVVLLTTNSSLVAMFTISDKKGVPSGVSLDKTVTPFQLSQTAANAALSCSNQLFLFPQTDGKIVVTVPVFTNYTGRYYCNGDEMPSVSAIVLTPDLKQVGNPYVAPYGLEYSAFGAVRSATDAARFMIYGLLQHDFVSHTVISSMTYNYHDSSVSFAQQPLTAQYTTLYNAENKAVALPTGNFYVLVGVTVYEITL